MRNIFIKVKCISLKQHNSYSNKVDVKAKFILFFISEIEDQQGRVWRVHKETAETWNVATYYQNGNEIHDSTGTFAGIKLNERINYG